VRDDNFCFAVPLLAVALPRCSFFFVCAYSRVSPMLQAEDGTVGTAFPFTFNIPQNTDNTNYVTLSGGISRIINGDASNDVVAIAVPYTAAGQDVVLT
jgi:hypothetical protein